MGSLGMTLCSELHPVAAPPGTAHAVTGLVLAGAATTAVLLLPRTLGATRARDDGETGTGTKTETRAENGAEPEPEPESEPEPEFEPDPESESETEV
ncbi:hypothetical protein ABZ484_06810 [Streptomyces sp. NPDC006393]|uniref:hypothetical protein n=1 Tax=Streptomyces sp. NPDC006393 TaxID=3156763 RepID=UPI0033EBF608